MAWTSSEVEKYILGKLGYPNRVIELDPSNLSLSLKGALEYFGSRKGLIKLDRFQVLKGQQAYDFSTLEKPYGSGIVTVYSEPLVSPSDVFNTFEVYRIRDPAIIESGDITLEKMFYSQLRDVTGSEWDWEWDNDRHILLITPIPVRTYWGAYEYIVAPAKIGEVPEPYQQWCVDYALAIAKEMLGRVRNKFQGVPGNDLPVQTDGADLIQEGLNEQAELRDKLEEKIGDIVAPIKG